MDFRQERNLIVELVKEARRNDSNWSWAIGKVLKHKVLIEWGYLNYLEEQHNSFCIKYENEAGTIVTYTPNNELIDIADSIEEAMLQIEHYAHSRY